MKMQVKCQRCKVYWPDQAIQDSCRCNDNGSGLNIKHLPEFMCPECHMEYHEEQERS